MRTRSCGKWNRTPCGNSIAKIKKAVADFPLLHAFGVGFDQFRSIPEHSRSKAIDYARYMLAFQLDDEIDGAIAFIRTLNGGASTRSQSYVRSDYLVHLYASWRLSTGKFPKDVPLGAFCVAALCMNCRVKVVEELKPHFLITVGKERRERIEKYLAFAHKFEIWPEDKIRWRFSKNGDRVDEQENELRSVDAVESKKGE